MKDTQTLRTLFRVSDFVAWQRDGSLELNPNFQRRPVWKTGAKSFLIDTILRGLPVPIIFLRDLPSDLKTYKPKRDVVDGQQRIRTILSFIDHDLLSDFDAERDDFAISRTHNKEHAGKRFAQLSRSNQQRILDYQFSVHSFAADTDDREILQIFARMNSTGVKLNPQELRNAEFYGEFKELAYELATEQLNRWRTWDIFTPNQIARMAEVELTSEFMILIMNGITGKSKASIDNIYKQFDSELPDGAEISARLRETFDAIASTFAADEIARFFSKVSVFYALFARVYDLRYGIRDPARDYEALPKAKPKPLSAAAVSRMHNAAQAVYLMETCRHR